MKQCLECKTLRPLDEFYRKPSNPNKRVARCWRCYADAAYRKRNPGFNPETNRDRRRLRMNRTKFPSDDFNRFILKSDNPSDCWLFMGKRKDDGYGAWYDKTRKVTMGAHRFAFMFFKGELLENLHVLHSCDNPPCCNPAHLYLGTHAENMADMVSKGRKKGCRIRHLTSEQVDSIIRLYQEGKEQREISKLLGIGRQAVRLRLKQRGLTR